MILFEDGNIDVSSFAGQTPINNTIFPAPPFNCLVDQARSDNSDKKQKLSKLTIRLPRLKLIRTKTPTRVGHQWSLGYYLLNIAFKAAIDFHMIIFFFFFFVWFVRVRKLQANKPKVYPPKKRTGKARLEVGAAEMQGLSERTGCKHLTWLKKLIHQTLLLVLSRGDRECPRGILSRRKIVNRVSIISRRVKAIINLSEKKMYPSYHCQI